jgi:hypothetical protein
VTDAAHVAIDKWFMGKSDDLCPNRTQKVTRALLDKTPYRVYHKFTVEWLKPS